MKTRKTDFLIIPVALWMIFLVLLPLIYIIILSFLSKDSNGNVIFVFTLDNYLRIFDKTYFKIFASSIKIAFLTSVITLIIGYPFAYFVAKLNKKIRFFIVALMMVPFWTSSLLRTYGWIILLQTEGLINNIMLKLGIIKEPVRMMYTYGAVLVGMVYMLLPFMILPIFNSIDKLDKSFIEASYDLGAGKAQTFYKIVFPLTLPGVIAGVMLVFIPSLSLFFISDLLGGAKTMLLGNLIRNQVTSARNWPFASALSVIMLLLVLIFYVLYNKALKKSERGGIS